MKERREGENEWDMEGSLIYNTRRRRWPKSRGIPTSWTQYIFIRSWCRRQSGGRGPPAGGTRRRRPRRCRRCSRARGRRTRPCSWERVGTRTRSGRRKSEQRHPLLNFNPCSNTYSHTFPSMTALVSSLSIFWTTLLRMENILSESSRRS